MRGTTFKAVAGTTMADARTEASHRGRKEVELKYPELVRLFKASAPDAKLGGALAPEQKTAPRYNPPTL